MLRFLALSLLVLSAPVIAAGDAAASATARLNAWLDSQYEQELEFSPIQLTLLGRRTLYDRIDDFSEEAEYAHARWREGSVAEMQRLFDYDTLSEQGQISYDYWVHRQRMASRALPFLRHTYIFTQNDGWQTELPGFLVTGHAVESEQDMAAYISRVRGIGVAIGQLLTRAQRAAQDGIRPPGFAYDSAIEEARRVIDGAPFDPDAAQASPLWADAVDKIAALEERGAIGAARAAALREEVAEALRENLLPAYEALIGWLQADRVNADENARGVSALPSGTAYYRYCLETFTASDISPDALHELGLAEVDRIRGELDALRRQVGFKGRLEEFFDHVRDDPQFYYPDDDAGRRAYLKESQHYLEQIEAKLPDYFGILPRSPLEVRRVEPFLEQPGEAAFYQQGTPDGARPGVYYLPLSDMSTLNRTELETTAYHEGAPGHHLQGAIALERSDLPLFRANSYEGAYTEGWALYAERLAKEMGGFQDPYGDFGRLVMEMWRAVRLVVDTGLHAKGWSEQQAVDYMLANTSSSEVTVQAEIRRYLVWPGQAVSYKVGMLKILTLREQARKTLGDRFDLRGFHDAVLRGGALPLPILDRQVADWIADRLQVPPGDARDRDRAPSPPAVAATRDLGVIATDPAVLMRDGGYSVGLAGESLWVFGDTILRHARGAPRVVLSNSWAMIADRDAADGLTGFREGGAGGAPGHFFPLTPQEAAFNSGHAGEHCPEPPCGARWAIWPGALLPDAGTDRVYAFYHKIRVEPGVLNFRHQGHSVAVWHAPAGPTERPRFDRYPDFPTLLLSGDRDGFGSAAVAAAGQAYVYGCEWRREKGPNACHLARVRLEEILNWKAWRFLSADGRWSERVEDAAAVFEGNTMMSVFRDPARERYLAVYSEPLGLRVLARAAPDPAGPWSDPAVLFTARAPVEGVGWVYDALAHPELSPDGSRTIYVSYSRQTGPLASELRLVEVTLQ